MPNRRIFWTLLITVMLALSASVTQAQSTEQTGENKEQQETPTAGQGGGILDVLARQKEAIVGTWLVTFANTGSKALITFNADGTLINSFQGEVSANPARPPHTSHHGVWRHLGGRQFGLTMWDIFYDINTGQLIQFTKLRQVITLENNDEASALGKADFLNPQGEVVRSGEGTFSYKRIKFEPFN
jgi:hypothetical protein